MDKPDENTAEIRCQIKPYIDQLHDKLQPPSTHQSHDAYIDWGINELTPFLETFLQSFTIDTEFRFTGFGMLEGPKQRKLRDQISQAIDTIRHNGNLQKDGGLTKLIARGLITRVLRSLHSDITRIKNVLDRECETNNKE